MRLVGLFRAKNKLGGHNQVTRTTRLKERRRQDNGDVNTRRAYSRNNLLMAKVNGGCFVRTCGAFHADFIRVVAAGHCSVLSQKPVGREKTSSLRKNGDPAGEQYQSYRGHGPRIIPTHPSHSNIPFTFHLHPPGMVIFLVLLTFWRRNYFFFYFEHTCM